MSRIDKLDYFAALKNYDRDKNINQHQRLGQYLINTFSRQLGGPVDTVVFYETDEERAKKAFRERYVKR